MEAIKTHYNGMWFDSRTEARWAVFFDQLGIPYIHEPEGFVFSDGTTYLPDFYLPDSKAFFECKGIMNDKDLHKIKMLMEESGRPVIVGYSDFTFDSCENDWGHGFYRAEKDDSVLIQCPCCKKWYFAGIEGFYECQCCGAYDGDHYFCIEFSNPNSYYGISEEVRKALDYALGKKFDKREMSETKKSLPPEVPMTSSVENNNPSGLFASLSKSFFDDLNS